MVRDAISHIEKIESQLSLSYEPTSEYIFISKEKITELRKVETCLQNFRKQSRTVDVGKSYEIDQ